MAYRFIQLDSSKLERYLESMVALAEAERSGARRTLVVQEPEFYARYHASGGATIIALDGDELVGFALLALPERLHAIWAPHIARLGLDPRRCGGLVQVLVDPKHRGHGLADALIEARIAAARHHGLRDLFTTVSPDNRPMLQLLERRAFRTLEVATGYDEQARRVLLHRELPERPLPARPREPLCELPTPLQPLPRLGAHLGIDLWIKRDDLTGLATGGNKSRMLERYVADARSRGCRTLVTRGHLLSNHCRQTAAAAARTGMDCVLVLKGDPPRSPSGNHLLSTIMGAEIHWTRGLHDETFARVLAEVSARGGAPYSIAYAGAAALGVEAFVDAAGELAGQGPPFDRIVLATSSGTTQAGLILGTIVHRLPTLVSGISVDDPCAVIEPRIAELAARVDLGLGAIARVAPRIEVDERYLGEGYGLPGRPEREAIECFAQLEGVLLDPVYTGRAAAGLIHRVRRKEIRPGERVLFWHTGGLPSLLALPWVPSDVSEEPCTHALS